MRRVEPGSLEPRSRVAYFVSKFPAASHTFIRREVDELRRQGLRVETFSLRPPLPQERQSESDRRAFAGTWYLRTTPLRRLLAAHVLALVWSPRRYVVTLREGYRHRVPGLVALLEALRTFLEAIALAVELRRRGHGHLHTHFANDGGSVAYLATRYLGTPWSLTLHGTSEFDYPAVLLLAAKIQAARFVVCVSHFGRAQAMRVVGPAQWAKLLVVRCGLELERRPDRRPDDPGHLVRLVSVGRLSVEKGQAGLIAALAKAIDRDAPVELRIVGEGRERRCLQQEIDRHRLAGRCTLVGLLSEEAVFGELAAADVFVLSSLMEGLPVVLVEAMSAGVPVIAPRVAGIPELVEHGVTGLLFNPGDWDELADHIVRLSEDRHLRARLGAAGRAYVEDHFDVTRTVVPLYHALTGRPASVAMVGDEAAIG